MENDDIIRCNTCYGILGIECEYPSQKNMWFLGDEKTNSICCDSCQNEACQDSQ